MFDFGGCIYCVRVTTEEEAVEVTEYLATHGGYFGSYTQKRFCIESATYPYIGMHDNGLIDAWRARERNDWCEFTAFCDLQSKIAIQNIDDLI